MHTHIYREPGQIRRLSYPLQYFFILDQGYKKIRLIRSLKSLFSDTKILSKYIPSLQKKL
jgi:hypothetical protein